MKIAFLESFYGGSHENFLDGLVKYSRHEIRPYVLPARLWKWRLRSSAIYFAQEFEKEWQNYDLIVASSMLNLAEFKALSGYSGPAIYFFHENQLTYPRPNGNNAELHFGFVNLVSALTADLNLFNSDFQLSQFKRELPGFINRIPEFVPLGTMDKIFKKSRVLYMGCDFKAINGRKPVRNDVPVILWNHRWEFDKQPEVFFDALYKLAKRDVDFRVVLLGENFQVRPKAFLEARDKLKDRILRYGFVESLDDYAHYLNLADIVISTSIQENFGFAVIEAMHCRTLPLLPKRLSYPEILDKKFHNLCLYKSDDDLVEKLEHLARNYHDLDNVRTDVSESTQRFHWEARIDAFDDIFEGMVS